MGTRLFVRGGCETVQTGPFQVRKALVSGLSYPLSLGGGHGLEPTKEIRAPLRLGLEQAAVGESGPRRGRQGSEDGTPRPLAQGALDLAGIPYTGPSAAGAMVGMDKLARVLYTPFSVQLSDSSKEIVRFHQVLFFSFRAPEARGFVPRPRSQL